MTSRQLISWFANTPGTTLDKERESGEREGRGRRERRERREERERGEGEEREKRGERGRGYYMQEREKHTG